MNVTNKHASLFCRHVDNKGKDVSKRWRQTEEFRHLSEGHTNHEDKLQVPMLQNFLQPSFTNVHFKLDRLFHWSQMFASKAGAYLSEDTLGSLLALPSNQIMLNCTIDCTVARLFDWFGISCMTTDNFCFYLQNRLIQTSQTGGQWYSDTSPFSIPCSNIRLGW